MESYTEKGEDVKQNLTKLQQEYDLLTHAVTKLKLTEVDLIKTIIELNRCENNLRLQLEVKEELITELESSIHELEQFAYLVAHDLQEPLRMISTYTKMLENRYKDNLDEDASEFIHCVVDGADRMQKLISDLLDYSRIGSCSQSEEIIDTNDVLVTVKSNLQILITENSASVTNDLLPDAKIDESLLTLVLQNLIENGIKFKKKTELPIVHISCVNKNTKLEFSVKDNGIGIEMENHDKVFNIFHRLNSAKDYPGTGIGLSICKHIIERLGGEIWFESIINEGTTFYFTIPV
jgi:light-regulated signal transduction histidine kinase (bacteriophytochrome)